MGTVDMLQVLPYLIQGSSAPEGDEDWMTSA